MGLQRLLLYSSIVLFSMLACTSPEQEPTHAYLSLNLGAEPSFLNPVLHSDGTSSSVTGLLFNGLMKVNENLEMEPDLCEKVTVSTDGLRYTFSLKRNVRWHDGIPFTADDVVFTFDTILSPKTNTVRRSSYIINGKAIQYRAIDRHTVEVTLPQPFAPFLTSMGIGILPKHRLINTDINTADFNRNPIGTGPFRFVEWRPSQYLRLEKNLDYFAVPVKLNGILFKIIPDKNTARISLQSGELDIESAIQAKDVPILRSQKHLDLYTYYSMGYTYMGFNLTKYPFNDRRFRLAISHAINRNAIVKSVLKGYGKPAILPSSSELWAYPDNPDQMHVYNYAPEKSKALIEDMGYTFNAQTQFYEKNGKPLQFTILTNKGNKYREKSAVIIQRFLQNVGIQVSIQLMEWSTFIKQMNDSDAFDAVIIGWGLGIDPDSFSIWHSSQYPKGFNYIAYNNPTVDTLLEQGRVTINKEKRKKIYAAMYKSITYDIPYYFLYHSQVISAVNARVGGIDTTPGPLGIIQDIEDIYIKP